VFLKVDKNVFPVSNLEIPMRTNVFLLVRRGKGKIGVVRSKFLTNFFLSNWKIFFPPTRASVALQLLQLFLGLSFTDFG